MKKNKGMALLTALIFLTVAVILLISLTARYVQQRVLADRFEEYYDCFQGLEAALLAARIDFEQGGSGAIGLDDWEPVFDANGALLLPDFDDTGVVPMALVTMPDIEFMAFTVNWADDGRDSNGDGIVDSPDEEGFFSIHAAARQAGVARRADVVYTMSDVGVWRNAIFAGTGAAGRLINGNVSIHGSVHLLGNDLPEGAVAVSAVDLSGTSLISNNYEGMPASLAARIPPLPTVEYLGEQMESLSTEVRVKRGRISMSGNSRIGEAHAPGSGVKNPVDATFVNDGWTGNSVTADGGRGIPTRVDSDNGWNELYDLGNRVPFPLLSDPWREPDGSQVMNPGTGTWYTHEEYFSEVLLADPVITNDGIFNGNIVLNVQSNDSNAVYWNATTGQYLTGAAALAASPNAGDDFILFNPNTNVLRINGQIRINGNLTFTGQGNQTTINYSGRAAILVDGNVVIDANLLTCNNGNVDNYANSFPVNNIMGIMATGDMHVGASSQLNIMGAFYAAGEIVTSRQTNVLGTFVANYFNMGNQVPGIFQVPPLADNLPFGMIGAFPIWVTDQVVWRETGIE